jgi:hypothetical protein
MGTAGQLTSDVCYGKGVKNSSQNGVLQFQKRSMVVGWLCTPQRRERGGGGSRFAIGQWGHNAVAMFESLKSRQR